MALLTGAAMKPETFSDPSNLIRGNPLDSIAPMDVHVSPVYDVKHSGSSVNSSIILKLRMQSVAMMTMVGKLPWKVRSVAY